MLLMAISKMDAHRFKLLQSLIIIMTLCFEIGEHGNCYSILTNLTDHLFTSSVCYELRMADVCLN